MMHFETIDYLQHGNQRQQAAYRVLAKYKVMERLAAFDPLLAGTIPIAIDVPDSDLDIICCWASKQQFVNTIESQFAEFDNFKLKEKSVRGEESIVAGFRIETFDVEIFGQNTPSREQHAYKHMLIEHQLLLKYGEALRQQVIDLKRQGIKTEPAFARLLNFPGDPYEALLKLEVV